MTFFLPPPPTIFHLHYLSFHFSLSFFYPSFFPPSISLTPELYSLLLCRLPGSRMQEGDDGRQIQGRHQDGRLQARTGAAESFLQSGSQHQGGQLNIDISFCPSLLPSFFPPSLLVSFFPPHYLPSFLCPSSLPLFLSLSLIPSFFPFFFSLI